jgi:hypothetical protein
MFGKPPEPMSWADILPDVLADAWEDGVTDGARIWNTVRTSEPNTPWPHVRTAINGAAMANKVKLPGGTFYFEGIGSSDAGTIVVELPDQKTGGRPAPPGPVPTPPVGVVKQYRGLSIATLTDIIEILPELISDSPDAEIVFDLSIRCTEGRLTDESKSKLEDIDD